MLNIINVLVNAISITFYNYLFENNSESKILKLKKYLITLGAGASCSFFVLSIIVNLYIKKYIESLGIISITFATFPYMILINALYVNLYKINKNEKKYFKVVATMLIISIIYNIIALLLYKNVISVAVATIITLVTWVIYSTIDLKNVKNDISSYIYLFLITVCFLVCSNYFSAISGGIIYFLCYLILTVLINKDVVQDLKKSVLHLKNKKERN